MVTTSMRYRYSYEPPMIETEASSLHFRQGNEALEQLFLAKIVKKCFEQDKTCLKANTVAKILYERCKNTPLLQS